MFLVAYLQKKKQEKVPVLLHELNGHNIEGEKDGDTDPIINRNGFNQEDTEM